MQKRLALILPTVIGAALLPLGAGADSAGPWASNQRTPA